MSVYCVILLDDAADGDGDDDDDDEAKQRTTLMSCWSADEMAVHRPRQFAMTYRQNAVGAPRELTSRRCLATASAAGAVTAGYRRLQHFVSVSSTLSRSVLPMHEHTRNKSISCHTVFKFVSHVSSDKTPTITLTPVS